MGRPRKYDLEKEAQDLLDWSKKDDSIALWGFTEDKDYCAEDLSDFAKDCEAFSQALRKAKERVGKRRELKCNNSSLNYGIWARGARIYDRLLDNHEKEVVEHKSLFEHKLKSQENLPVNNQMHEALMHSTKESYEQRKRIEELEKQLAEKNAQ